jgi:hypothetical protein
MMPMSNRGAPRCNSCTNSENEYPFKSGMIRKFAPETIAIRDGHLYGPLSMRTGRPSHGPGRWSSTVVVPFAALLGSLTLASCGSSAVSGQHGGSATDPSRSTPSSTATPEAAVISAWLAAEKAFHQAALTSDPDDPGLEATMINPELAGVQSALMQLKNEGVIGRGPTFYGSPHVTSSEATIATVVSCEHGEEIAVNAESGVPVPGVLGQPVFELVTSKMHLTNSGWKLESQTVGVGKCGS